jgi:Zn-dependent protease with chaperone function
MTDPASTQIPGSSVARVLATILAVPVHLLSLAILILGIVVLVKGVQPGASLVAILLLGLAWEARPRLGRPPTEVVPREQLEELYRLTDEVSNALGTDRVAGLVLSPWFKAWTERSGIRRRAFVGIGLPLFAILDPQERVAVIAHEIAHLANRDPRRTTVLGSALRTLDTWDDVLGSSDGGLVGLLWWMLSIVPALLVIVYRQLLLGLVLRESRRSELLADRLGAELGGSRSSASALKKLGLAEELHHAGMGAALDGDPTTFFDSFRARVSPIIAAGTVPEPDPGERVDTTHPSTAVRIALLEQDQRDPALVLSASRSGAIDRSLRPFEERLAVDLIDSYRDLLHGSSIR